jgi:two-component system nitrogen regulation sensor histidine kinase NtrY
VLKAAAPVIHGDKVVEVVVAETLLDAKLVEKIDSIIDAYNTDYKQIENQQKSIQILYFLVLAVITMLIIYLSIWISIRIARSITVPITTLASAANAVAKGDMNVKIEMARKDEVGVLIDSFNAMVNELREGKLSLEQAYREADRGRLSLTAILQNINTGVIFLDNKRNILTANAAACSILSLEIHDIIGQDYRKILSKIESEELHDLIRRINETKFDYIEQEIIGLIDKKLMTIRIQIMALKDSQHISMGILVVFDDLTEIVKAQRALAWQEVARRIAHEIKNPLTPIKLSTERLIRKKEQQAPDFDNVFNRATKTIIKEVESLKNLVNEFARFGTMPAVHKQPGNINLLIEAALELYNDYKGVHFEKLFETVPELSFDHEQFKRMIINLIDNAIHAKAERIELATSFNPQFESVSIEVRDNGVGVKDEDKSKLFLPYFSTKKSGTGLGLAIVDKVVSEHRGYMRVKDNEPRGTIFAIELPIKA